MSRGTITLVCVCCGCERDAREHEVPVGQCEHCLEGLRFEWLPVDLEPGDAVFVNAHLPQDSKSRVAKVVRGKRVIYQEQADEVKIEVPE